MLTIDSDVLAGLRGVLRARGISETDVSMDQVQEVLGKRYRMLQELGRGGMAVVFLAHETSLDRAVALKILPPLFAASRSQRAQFLREARLAAGLSHPNLVPVHAVESVGDFIFYTMDYVEGETLAEQVRSRGPLTVAEATRMLCDVAAGVSYAHEHGIVHQDIKPENIIIERHTGRAMVMDFGVARASAEPDLVKPGYIVGTAHYMSPERMNGAPGDKRSDIYALGVTGYFAVTGAVPFDGKEDLTEICQAQLTQPAPWLRVYGEDMDLTFARSVQRCLEPDPSHRFEDGRDLLRALMRAPELRKQQLPFELHWFVSQIRGLTDSIVLATQSSLLIVVLGIGLARDPEPIANIQALPLALALILFLCLKPVWVVFWQTRSALRDGYTLDDLVHAVSVSHKRETELIAFYHRGAAGRIRRWTRRVAWGGVALAGLGTAAMVAVAALGSAVPGLIAGARLAMGGLIAGVVASVLAGIVGRVVARPWRDRTGEWWLRFWQSRFGAMVLRVAGWRVKPKGPPAALPEAPEIAHLTAPSYEYVWQQKNRDVLNQAPAVTHLADTAARRIRNWLRQDTLNPTERIHLTETLVELETLRHRIRDVEPRDDRAIEDFEAVRKVSEGVTQLLDRWDESKQPAE